MNRRQLISGTAALLAYSQLHGAEAQFNGCPPGFCPLGGAGNSPPPVAGPQFIAGGGGLPAAVSTALTSIIGGPTRVQGSERYTTGYQASQGMQIHLPGFIWNGGAETVIPQAMPVQGTILFPGATTPEVRITWGGNNQGSIPPGGIYSSDVINSSAFGMANFPANTPFYIKFQVDLTTGASNFSGVGRDVIDPDCANYYGSQAAYTSQLMNGVPVITSAGATGTGNNANPPAWTIRAWAVTATPVAPMESILYIGDSLTQGQGGPPFPTQFVGSGSVAIGMANVNGAYVPWASNAVFGTQGQGYQANAVFMKALYQYATTCWAAFGSNDTGSVPTILAAFQQTWANLKANPGSKITTVVQRIVPPRSSSTDSWATLANQTTANTYATLNTAMTGNVGSNGLDAVINIPAVFANPISTPGAWTGDGANPPDKFPVTGFTGQAGPTVDGTHPTDFLARDQQVPGMKTWALGRLQTRVTAAPTNTTAPFIIGARYQGATLTVMTGAWSVGSSLYNSLSFQWKSGGANVGTNSPSYTLVAGDVGNTITCTVTATNGAGSTSITTSATGTVLAPAPTPPSFPATGAIVSSASIAAGSSTANITFTGSQTDPLGGTTATKVAYSTTANSVKVVNYSAAAVVDANQYTASIYAKPVEYQFFYLIAGGGLNRLSYIFDVLNGLVFPISTSLSAARPVILPDQVGIIAEPNGWFRCYITITAINSPAKSTNTSGSNFQFGPMSTNSGDPNNPGAGTAGSGLLFWRAQLVPGGIDS